MSGLTQQQLAFFREEGYLLVEDAIDPSVSQRLRAELDEGIDAFARAELADGRLSDAHAEEPFERRLHLLALQLADSAPCWPWAAASSARPACSRSTPVPPSSTSSSR